MDLHFKIKRAREEIHRLDVEIRRFVTYMCDEEEELIAKRRQLSRINPALSYQVDLYRRERSRFNSTHIERFFRLAKDPRVTAIKRGTKLRSNISSPRQSAPPSPPQSPPPPSPPQSQSPSPPSPPPAATPATPYLPDADADSPDEERRINPEDLLQTEEALDDEDADAEEEAEEDELWRQTFTMMNGVLVITEDSGVSQSEDNV